jgi:MFS family permease
VVATAERGGDADFARVTAANGVFFVGLALFLILPARLQELGADPRQVGLYMGLGGVAPLVVMPVVGSLVDRHGTRRFLIVGYLVAALAAAGYFGLRELGAWLAVLRLAGGAAYASLWVAGSVFAARVAPPGRLAQRVGIFGAATLLTHAVGPPLGELLVGRWGWSALYGAATGLMLLGLAAVWGVPDPPAAVAERRPGMVAVALGAAGPPLLVGFLAATAWGAAFYLLPAALHARGAHSAPFFTAYAGTALATRLVAGELADRHGRIQVAAPALVVHGLAVVGLSRGLGGGAPILVAGSVFGLTHGLHYPALAALALDRTEPAGRSRAMSLFNLAFNAGAAGGAMAYGALARWRGYPLSFAAAGALAAASAAILAWGRDRR